jgi:HAE1 family hydrophobic/amphiphilic exporter-1
VRAAQQLEKVPGLVDVKLRYKPGRPEVRIEVDRAKASLFQFTIQDIAESLHAQIRGLRATYFLTPTAQIETVARLKEMYRKTLDEVQILSLINPRGTIVPVHQFANFEFGLTPSEIWRKDRERMIQVSANRGEVALSKVADDALRSLKDIRIPAGYYYEVGGDFPKMIETERESRFAFVIMVLLVYAVLASLFESYVQPLVILLAVPLTLIGAIPLLYFSKTPVTLGTLIGFIMLGGISVSNSIILVDVFNHIRKERRTFYALLKAGEERIRPILMTTLTTILGLAPLVFQKGGSGSLWSPLAITVIGGLSVSTVLVLFILPAFYLILQDGRSWFLEKMGKAVPSG